LRKHLKTVVCQLCGSRDVFPLYNLDEYRILKCHRCHLVFTEALDIDYAELYSSDYFEKFQGKFFSSCLEDYSRCEKDPRLANFARGLRLLGSYKKAGKILDVGCATGVFLDMAKKEGWEPYGVDISEYAANYAREKFGIKVEAKELQDVGFPARYFDVITMWDTIEHLPNPRQTLEESLRILKDKGLIFILTIDEDSLIPRLAHLMYKCSGGKLKKPVKLVHPVHHVTHFSKSTLVRMLEMSGFEVIHLKKSEIPLQSLRWGWVTKTIIGIMYTLAKLLNMQYEIRVLAEKAETG
jgi:2-polyprenyl-3-methyl-5-hydroxy-6-metoxy-1,4-benzoquinol methylase